jgi:nucleoside-diphosphate-sugar epimerase
MARIVVTGGSGFIGSRVVDRLISMGHDVVVLDLVVNPRFASITIQGDVADPAAVERALRGADAVLNLAAQHRDDVRPTSRYYETNVEGMRVLCSCMEALGIRKMVFTSSVAVYGFDTDDCTEDDEKVPDNDYGRSKLQAEAVLEDWRNRCAENVALVVRPCAVFGPGNRGNIYNLLAQVMTGRFFMVGDGRNRKSIAFVDNVVEAILFLFARSGSLTVNYADKPDLDMNELVRTIASAGGRSVPRMNVPKAIGMAIGGALDILARVTGRNFPLSRVRVRKFCANSVVNASRIRSLGFTPPLSLEQGIKATVRAEFRSPG